MARRGWSRSAVAYGGAAAMLLAACGGSSGNGAYGGSGGGTAQPSAAVSAPTTEMPSAPAGTPPAAGTTIIVTETEFAIKLSPNTLKAGTTTFVTDNAGHFPHALEIEGPGITEKKTSVLQPGGSQKLTVTLQKGKYELYCPVDSHKDKGMKLEMNVS